jgi:hypothetical protein
VVDPLCIQQGPAGIYIFEAGTNNRSATGDTSRDSPEFTTLNAGNYDPKVLYRKAIPEKEVIVRNLQIVLAQTTTQQVEYQEGTRNVNVTSGGNPTGEACRFICPENPNGLPQEMRESP